MRDRIGLDINIREYQTEDRPGMMAMYDDFEPKGEAMGLPPPDDEVRKRWIDDIVKTFYNFIALRKKKIIGSGGYVLDNIERSWTLAWAAMNDLEPDEDESVTFGGMFWGDGLSSLIDRLCFLPDNIRIKTAKEVKRVYRHIEKNIFPILGISALAVIFLFFVAEKLRSYM